MYPLGKYVSGFIKYNTERGFRDNIGVTFIK